MATPQQQVALGRALAAMYCAAQGVSMEASDAACSAVEDASPWVKFGFDQRMSESEYPTRALPHSRVTCTKFSPGPQRC